MHYTIDYKGLRGNAKRQKALKDCEEFLGTERYRKLTNLIRLDLQGDPSRKNLRFIAFGLSFSGIQGYPAKAMALDNLRHRTTLL